MADIKTENNKASFNVNIFLKKEDGMYVAHCMELDIVAVANTADQAQEELISLVCAQIDYAFSNDNLDNLFHSAPVDVWEEFFQCKKRTERDYPLESGFPKKQGEGKKSILPPWLTAKVCEASSDACYA
jgi:hypothetical protein